MNRLYQSCLHFKESEVVDICEYLDAKGYDYTVRYLVASCTKHQPWSISIRNLTLEQLEDYRDHLDKLRRYKNIFEKS